MSTPRRAHGSFLCSAGTSAARSGRSLMCPMLDSTENSGPRKREIVRAFAGDSTITSFVSVTANHLSPGPRTPRRAGGHTPGRAAVPRVPRDRASHLSPRGGVVPAARAGSGERAGGWRGRAGGEPQLEPRPVGTRTAALPAPSPALHGEVGAVLVSAGIPAERGRRVPRPARPARRRGDPHGRRALPAGRDRRDVPGGNAAPEGAAEEVGGPRPHGRRPDRARRRRAARPRRDHRNRQSSGPRPVP